MPHRILILLFGDLGDTLLRVPALRAIRSRYPDARIIALTKELPAQILGDLGLVDEVMLVDKHVFDSPKGLLRVSTIWALAGLFLRLRGLHVDTVVVMQHLVTRWGTLKYALLALASGAPRRIGLDNGRGWFLTESVRDEGFGAQHESEYWMHVASVLDASGPIRLEAPVSEEDRYATVALLAHLGLSDRRLIAIHPGAGWFGPGRRWPASRFARAAECVIAQEDVHALVVGTDSEAREVDEVAQRLGDRATNLCGKTSMAVLAALLQRCEVVIANDGGVAHLAAAAGAPVVTVFGPSNDRAWRPLTGTVVAADLPCRPCFYRDFETGLPNGCHTRECLAMVTPESVGREALRVLRRTYVPA